MLPDRRLGDAELYDMLRGALLSRRAIRFRDCTHVERHGKTAPAAREVPLDGGTQIGRGARVPGPNRLRLASPAKEWGWTHASSQRGRTSLWASLFSRVPPRLGQRRTNRGPA